MAFDSFHLTSTVGSAGTFQIYPTYGFTEEIIVNRKINRSISGGYNSYQLQGDFFRYSLPMTYVSSEERSYITEWWADQREMVLTINLSSNPESLICRISNDVQPFAQNEPFQYDKFAGNLVLRSVKPASSPVSNRFPFILDNSSLGLLDQAYNFLDEELPKPSTPGKGKGGPFLLDNETWGILDQVYNLLL